MSVLYHELKKMGVACNYGMTQNKNDYVRITLRLEDFEIYFPFRFFAKRNL